MSPLSPLSEVMFGGPSMSLLRGPGPSSAAAAAEHDDFPARPARALVVHVLVKGLQVGACLGVVAAPLWSLARARPLSAVFSRVVLSTSAVGLAASVAALAGKGAQGALDTASVDDRAFRLARNASQAAADRTSALGAAAGLTAATILVGTGLAGAAAGAATGAAAGLAARAASAALTADAGTKPMK